MHFMNTSQKGIAVIWLIISVVGAIAGVGGVGVYAFVQYDSIAGVLNDAEDLVRKQQYEDAAQKIESVKDGFFASLLGDRIDQILQESQTLAEDHQEYEQGLRAMADGNWQEAEGLLAKVSTESPWYPQAQVKIAGMQQLLGEQTDDQGSDDGAAAQAVEEARLQAQQALNELAQVEAKIAEERTARVAAEKLAQQKQQELEAKQKEQESTPPVPSSSLGGDLTSIVAQWKPYIAPIECEWQNGAGVTTLQSTGTATLVKTSSWNSFRSLTNAHVIVDYETRKTPTSCTLTLPQENYSLESKDASYFVALDKSDLATIEFQQPPQETSSHIEGLLAQWNPAAHVCASRASAGEEVVILGYPAIGSRNDITVTRGIISGYEDGYYVTDAKIDRGNSGGAAILIKQNCLVGIPTAVAVGVVESLGRILDVSGNGSKISLQIPAAQGASQIVFFGDDTRPGKLEFETRFIDFYRGYDLEVVAKGEDFTIIAMDVLQAGDIKNPSITYTTREGVTKTVEFPFKIPENGSIIFHELEVNYTIENIYARGERSGQEVILDIWNPF